MFSRVAATNFLSWEKLEFDFTKGITLVTGFNYDDGTPEGSGKSAILNALCYGLYGRLPKESKVDDVIREGAKGCTIDVILKDGTRISRSRGPNALVIQRYEGFEKDPTSIRGKDLKETQTLIDTLIGMGFETFCQSVYFAQNYPNKFITASEDEKAKILSEITGIGIFDRARKTAHELRNEVESKLSELKIRLEATDQEIAAFQHELESLKELAQKMEEEKLRKVKAARQDLELAQGDITSTEGRVHEARKDVEHFKSKSAAIEAKISDLQGEMGVLKNKLSSESARQETIRSLKLSISKEKTRIERLKSEVQAHENPKNKTCPTCGTVLEKMDKSVFASKIAELNDEIQDRVQEVMRLEKNLQANLEVESSSEISDRITEITRTISANKTLLDKGRASENLLSTLLEREITQKKVIRKMYADLELLEKSEIQDFSYKISEIKAKIAKKREKREEQGADTEALMLLGKGYTELKDGFREVKSYVFQGILKELNRKANKYLSELFEVPVKLVFDNTSDSGDISKIHCSVTIDGTERPLGLYSGGQFRRIQLAVDFALSDVIAARSDRPINLIVLDEAFKDLSSTSMEKVLNLLTSTKKSAILIEHNEVFKSVVSNTFEVEYRNGISTRVERS